MTAEPQPGGGAPVDPAGGPPPGEPGGDNRTTQIVVGVVAALVLALLGAWALGFGPFARPAATNAPATLAPATVGPSVAATTAATEEPTAEPTAEATDEPTEEPTLEPTAEVTPEPTPSAVADACAGIETMLKNPGRLTLSTDNPAFGPWFGGSSTEQYPNEPEGGSAWGQYDFSADPYSGEGFEGSLAYAVAERMGFTPDLVDWIPNEVFEQAFAPGEKPFDFHMAQIAATPERAVAVTFSEPYFMSSQSILAMTGNPITAATTIEQLKTFRLGAAANSTALTFLQNVIQPTTEISVFNDNAGARQALQSNTVDGIVVDLVTAFFMRDAQIEDFDTPEPEGTIVGQFSPALGADEVSYVLELGNPLVGCVNQALSATMEDGTHEQLLDQWINTGQEIPYFE